MIKIYFSLCFLFACFCVNNAKAFCRTANCTGDWCTGGTWTPNGIPQCGDTIVIPAGYRVNITTMENYFTCGQVMNIDIYGELHFQTGKKIILPCDSKVSLKSGGKITADNGGGNANYIEICSQVVWNAGDGTLYGPIVLTASSPLPVELLGFNATQEKRKVLTSWTTASEQNSLSFSVERSVDGFNFNEVVGTVPAAGFSAQQISYTLMDNSPLDGKSYYRLKLVNTDGTVKFYNSVLVEFDDDGFEIFPNPSDGRFTVSDNEKNTTSDFCITDCSGKRVFMFSTGNSQTEIATHLESGLYFIQRFDKKFQKKILIRKD